MRAISTAGQRAAVREVGGTQPDQRSLLLLLLLLLSVTIKQMMIPSKSDQVSFFFLYFKKRRKSFVFWVRNVRGVGWAGQIFTLGIAINLLPSLPEIRSSL